MNEIVPLGCSLGLKAQDRVQIPSIFWVRKKITWELLTWEMCTAVSEVQLRPSYETKPVFKTLPHLGLLFFKKEKAQVQVFRRKQNPPSPAIHHFSSPIS